MIGYILLLAFVGIVSFFGGFGCGVEYEYLRNKDNIKNDDKEEVENETAA